MDKKVLKQKIKEIKTIIENAPNVEMIHKSFELLYERITNHTDKNYNDRFNLQTILGNKTIKEIKKCITEDTAVVIEFVKYDIAPNGFVIIYNDFNEEEQSHIDIYITKEEQKCY